MISVNIDFSKANTITNEINNTASDISTISSSASGISADAFASYSPGTVGLNESFISGLSKIVPSCDNFLSKFKGYIQTYYDAYQEQLHEVEEEIVEKPEVAEHSEFYAEHAIASTGKVTFTISDDKASEIAEKNKFYYGYPGNVSEVHEISSSKLIEIFEANGAEKAINGTYSNGHTTSREGDGWYKFETNEHSYEYNVYTNEIIVDYTLPCYTFKGGKDTRSKFSAKFFVTDDTDFDAITNTITVCGGQGILDQNEPRYDNNPAKTFMTGINANKNSLVIVPYGHGYGTVAYNIAPGVASSTVIGDFMCGAENKKIKNSIVGFSLGGQAAYEAVGQNKGLYSTLVACNTSMQGGLTKRGGDYGNFEGVKIIAMESSADRTDLHEFEVWHGNAINSLCNQGVSPDNIYIVSNNSKFIKNCKKSISEDHISDFNGVGWSKHNCGIKLLKESGIFAYLSEEQ